MASPISLPYQCGSLQKTKSTESSPLTVHFLPTHQPQNTSSLVTAKMSAFPPEPVDTIGTSFECNCIFLQADKKTDWWNVGFKIREGTCHDLQAYTPSMNVWIIFQHDLRKELGQTGLNQLLLGGCTMHGSNMLQLPVTWSHTTLSRLGNGQTQTLWCPRSCAFMAWLPPLTTGCNATKA
jgi:hypothetical protein